MAQVSVIGSGSWGTALAMVLHQNNHRVLLYGRRPEHIEALHLRGTNDKYLPGIRLPDNMVLTSSLEEAVAFSRTLIFAIPSHAFRETLKCVGELTAGKPICLISATKGLEENSLKRMEEVAGEVNPSVLESYTTLSGPSHAEEVAQRIPTTVVAASRDSKAARNAQKLLMTPTFRVYTHGDVTGVELGGALKNVIAVAAGICDGVGFGDNTKAALITRGLAEITRLGVAMGAKALTFAGLSGMGDLIATCMSRHSRNRFVGEQIGRGQSLAEVLEGMHMVAEGIRTTKAAHTLALKQGIEMPITQKVYAVLFEQESPKDAVANLMSRQAKAEEWGYR